VKVIASTGGKGGTGKSTFAVLLSLKLSKSNRVLLVDADVECPNDHLLLNKTLENGKDVFTEIPRLVKEKCKKCGKCVEVCRFHAVFLIKGSFPTFVEDLCSSCGACWLFCPFKAIYPEKKSIGKIFTNRVNENLWLITGRSNINVANTSEVVKELIKEATKFAEGNGIEYMIVDTSVGTHCNVIHALVSADKIYVVTEPTPLGAYDLRLILKVIKRLGKEEVEIVLNRADVGDEKEINEIAEEFSVPISLRIPYSEELFKAYCEGDLEKMVNLIE